MSRRHIFTTVTLWGVAAFLLMCGQACAQQKKKPTPKRPERIEEHIDYRSFEANAHSEYILDKTVDLNGEAWQLPEGMTIVCRGGIFRNGTLAGNGTCIKFQDSSSRFQGDGVLFDNVRIKGSWNVPHISTAIFRDLSYDNALRDVMALASPAMQNTVTIAEGCYTFALKEGDDIGIVVPDSTHLVLYGTLTMKPCNMLYYDIISVEGENIHITGRSNIVGDKDRHKGIVGEWGMGVRFKGARNCSLAGLSISECWGDGICIGHESKDITVRNCNISKCRRQGITVGAAENVLIEDVNIADIAGTKPEYAIDVEPNKTQSASNVVVRRVTATNCQGAFKATVNRGSSVTGVVFDGCKAFNTGRWPVFKIKDCKNVLVKDCIVEGSNSRYTIVAVRNKDIAFRGNSFHIQNRLSYTNKDIVFDNNEIIRQ